MAITTSILTSFKGELLKGGHNLDAAGDTLKMSLIKSGMAGTYGAASTNYSNITGNTDEASGTGYTAGGASMTNSGVSTTGTTAIADFGNVTWAGATISVAGCMMYNSSKSNKGIAVWDFGGTQSVSAATFTITMPASGASTSLIRIA